MPFIHRQQGLTIIELMTTLAIVAITTSIAVPSFGKMIKDGKQDAELNQFKQALSIARSESVKRGLPTVMCASTNGSACANTAWTNGWLVFVDTDNDGTLDSTEELVRAGLGVSTGLSLIGSANVTNLVRYNSVGDSSESGAITLCDSRGADYAQAVIISPSGKAKTSETGLGGAALSCP